MNRLYKLRTHGYVEIGDDVWFPNLQFNGLIKIKKSSGRIEKIEPFPDYDIWCDWLYSSVYRVEDILVFVPCTSKEIVAYDVKKEKFIVTALDKNLLGENKPYFVSGYVRDHYVYMFPVRARYIIKYDVISHEVYYLENGLNTILCGLPPETVCFYQQYQVINEMIYLSFAELNAIAIFNLRDESLKVNYLDIRGGCSAIYYMQGNFYLASWKYPEIYRWNWKTGKIKRYLDFPKEFSGGNYVFSYLCGINEKIFAFPHEGNMIVSFDIKTGQLVERKEIRDADEEGIHTYFVKESKKGVRVLTADMESACFLDYSERHLKWEPCPILDAPYNKKRISQFLLEQGYYEDFLEVKGSLAEYVEMLTDFECENRSREESRCGKLIFEKVRY